MSERPVTKHELAQMANCSVSTIERRMRDGLPSVRYGKQLVRFFPSKALPWLAQYGEDVSHSEGSG